MTDRFKAAILLGAQMADAEARHMLAQKAAQAKSHDELCRAVLAARDEVFRLQLAAMMPDLTVGQIKCLKRQERAARTKRRALCAMLQADIVRRMPPMAPTQLPLPFPKPEG
jgi:hypothetical protein